MKTFPLRIGTPDGLLFEGNVVRVVCRTITGDLAVLADHCNFCTALGMGEAHVVMEDGERWDAGTACYRRNAFDDGGDLPFAGNHLGVEKGY